MANLAEVTGIIKAVEYGKNGSETKYKLECVKMNKTFEVSCSFFCPIKQGDIIYAICLIIDDKRLKIVKQPFVQPPVDKDSIIIYFIKILKIGYQPANKIYNKISNLAEGDENVIGYLSEIAQLWNDTHKTEILYMFDGINGDKMKTILNAWHKDRNLRRLYLFNLTNKEINGCRMTCDDIFKQCKENPYTLPSIPLEKCDNIYEILHKKPDIHDRIKGSIVRVIWKNLNENGWTGTPSRNLGKQFPDLRTYIEDLKKTYNIVVDSQTLYLKHPYNVERKIAQYLTDKVINDDIKYDTPLDTQITVNSRLIERQSAHFTRELSDDQKAGIQGALDHKISIITGGAGSGKCLGRATKILMYDGTIKNVEDIVVGDNVMGPDSKPKRVVSLCSGVDDMYEIIPDKGKSFICNGQHILTLQGITPVIINTSHQKYIVKYTTKGLLKNKIFKTLKKACHFKSQLSTDIFDVSVDDYLKRKDQTLSHVFHVSVCYPANTVPIHPYLIGYWLGNENNHNSELLITDCQIVDKINTIISQYNLEFKNTSLSCHYQINGRNNYFQDTLTKLNLINNKHIPPIYKINSYDVRLNILAGLIDATIYNSQADYIEILQKNEILTNDIEYLAFSLGFMVVRENDNNHQKLKIFLSGTVVTKLHDIPLVSSNRFSKISHNKNATTLKFKIEKKCIDQYYGFTLNGDGRFLLADFLVTHNSSCIGEIIHNLELRGISYAVCSFTGKAVARIRDITKKKNASTIHRLISNAKNKKNYDNNDYQQLIVDEASMTTTELLYELLEVYPNIEKLTLVGDSNQLPPIGWGNLFSQILKSETIPTYKLTMNHRVYTSNGDRDGVILNANSLISHINNFPFQYVQTDNFNIIEGAIERVYDILKGCKNSNIKSDQLVIITPYNKNIDELNSNFQTIYNQNTQFVVDSRNRKWILGDRVMLNENDQEIGVFNGESGIIKDINEKSIFVDFGPSGCHEFLLECSVPPNSSWTQSNSLYNTSDDDAKIFDNERTVKRLVHSYALTIDKSQGSEWDFVILFINEFNSGNFINKNRIYTALTRTKRAIWIVVPDLDSFQIASTRPLPFKCDNLHHHLSLSLPHLAPFKISPPLSQLEMNNDLFIPEDSYDYGYDPDDL